MILNKFSVIMFVDDCEYYDWTSFGKCNVTCGIGAYNRTRKVKGGIEEEIRACSLPAYTMSFRTCILSDCGESSSISR